MLIEEIEEAEKKAEEIIRAANAKATGLLEQARASSYENLVKEAGEKAAAIIRKAEGEAKAEPEQARKFFIPAKTKRRLASELADKVVKACK